MPEYADDFDTKRAFHEAFWRGAGPSLILIPPSRQELYDVRDYAARFHDPQAMWESEIRRAEPVRDWPNDGEVNLTFSTSNPEPLAFAFQFRTPRWCESISLRVNDDAPVTIDPLEQERGCYALNRVWQDGDVVSISMPMAWRLLRGRAVQDGRVALLRGPVVYCIGKDQNAELLATCPEPRNLVIDPRSIAEPVRGDSIRSNGLKTVAKAWLDPDCSGEPVEVVLTEFIDPSGQEVYFRVPSLGDTSPVRLTDDEIVSWPNEFVNAHVVKALYGPRATGDLKAVFEIRGDIVADLAADDVLGSFNTKDVTVGKCGNAEFVLRLPPGEIGAHLDFVLHNAGNHICDATALRIRAYTDVRRAGDQTDVTETLRAKYRNRLVTPLGSYATLFGEAASGAENTLKVKLHYWLEGVVKYLEFPHDSALDLTDP